MTRGTRIEYTYAGGKVVKGKVLRLYTAREVEQHRRSHGDAAAERLHEWIPCELYDEAGSYTGACHVSQLRAL